MIPTPCLGTKVFTASSPVCTVPVLYGELGVARYDTIRYDTIHLFIGHFSNDGGGVAQSCMHERHVAATSPSHRERLDRMHSICAVLTAPPHPIVMNAPSSSLKTPRCLDVLSWYHDASEMRTSANERKLNSR
jgi:hypothetical protein